jgi:uncharacterized protein (DUF1810 family)
MSLPREVTAILTRLDNLGLSFGDKRKNYDRLISWFEDQQGFRQEIAEEICERFLGVYEPEIQSLIITRLAKFRDEKCLKPLMDLAKFSGDTTVRETAEYWLRIQNNPASALNDLYEFLAVDAALSRSSSRKELRDLLMRLPADEIENVVDELSRAAHEYPQILFCVAQLPPGTGYHEEVIQKIGILQPDQLGLYLRNCWEAGNQTELKAAVELLTQIEKENRPNCYEAFVKASDNGKHYDCLVAIARILFQMPNDERLLSFLAFAANQYIPLKENLLDIAFRAVKNLSRPVKEAEIEGKARYHKEKIFRVLRQSPQIYRAGKDYVPSILDELQNPLSGILSVDASPESLHAKVENLLFAGRDGRRAREGLIILLAMDLFENSTKALPNLFNRSAHDVFRCFIREAIYKAEDLFGWSQDALNSIEGIFDLFFGERQQESEPEQQLERVKVLLQQALSSTFEEMTEYLQVLEATLKLLNQPDRRFGLAFYSKELHTIGEVPDSDFAVFRNTIQWLATLMEQQSLDLVIDTFRKTTTPLEQGRFCSTLFPIIDDYLNSPIQKTMRDPLALQLADVFSPQDEGGYGIGLQQLTHYEEQYFKDLIDCCHMAENQWALLVDTDLEDEYGMLILDYITECSHYVGLGGKAEFPDQDNFKDRFRIPLRILFQAPDSHLKYKSFKRLFPAARVMLESYLEDHYHSSKTDIPPFETYVEALSDSHQVFPHRQQVLKSLMHPEDNSDRSFIRFLTSYLSADDRQTQSSQIDQLYREILSLHHYAVLDLKLEFSCPTPDLEQVISKLPRSVYYECSRWHRAFRSMMLAAKERGGASQISVRLDVMTVQKQLRLVIRLGDNGDGFLDEQRRPINLERVFVDGRGELVRNLRSLTPYCSRFIIRECHYTGDDESRYEMRAYDILNGQQIERYAGLLNQPGRHPFDPLFTGENEVRTGTIYEIEIPVWQL